MWIIGYLILVIVFYVVLRYLVIKGKGFTCIDEPPAISLAVALFWAAVLFMICIYKSLEYIDKLIKLIVNEKVNRGN